MKPLAIDLYCGLGGWADGFLAEGWDVVGFDVERHEYGTGGYPGQLVLQDVLTLDGRQFRNASVIVASPPCQEFSYMAMPWSRAKEKAAYIRARQTEWARLTALFWTCFRIAREAGVPLVVENVKGAQPWVGAARWHYRSFYLWGDVPALMPTTFSRVKGLKVPSEEGRRTDPGKGARFTTRDCGDEKGFSKQWSDSPNGMPMMSRSNSRKAASAQIAKIPFPLAQHIARVFRPERAQ